MLDQTLCSMNAVGEWHIGLVLEFGGRLDERRLAEALRLTLVAEPFLAGRFVPGWWSASWEWPTVAPAAFALKTKPRGEQAPEANRFFLEPVDHQNGPQVQALLLRGETDALCLKLSHFAADAGGVKAYAYLLADCYRRLETEPDYRPPVNRRSRSLKQIGDLFGPGGKWKIVKRFVQETRANPPRPYPYNMPGRYAPPEGRMYIVRHLGPERFRALEVWRKQYGLTINDVLIAALLRSLIAVAANGEERRMRLIGTVDLRRYLPAERRDAIANLSGWVYANFGGSPGETLRDTALLVGAEMNLLKNETLGLSTMPFLYLLDRCCPLAQNQRMYSWLMKKIGRTNSFAPSLTNMGVIDPARLNFGDIPVPAAYLVVPLIYPPTFGAGVSGFRDTLTLSAGFCTGGTDASLMNRLFDRWLQELPR